MKLSRRSFFLGAAVGGAASFALGKIALPTPKKNRPKNTTGARYELTEHARKYYNTAKV